MGLLEDRAGKGVVVEETGDDALAASDGPGAVTGTLLDGVLIAQALQEGVGVEPEDLALEEGGVEGVGGMAGLSAPY